MTVSHKRAWITREEIAGIVQARIDRRVEAFSKDRLTVLDEMVVCGEVHQLTVQRDTIRATDKLFSNPVGERV